MNDRPRPPVEQLLAHREWARSLAASLVADSAHAEDLVQDAWVAVLERPPLHASNPRGFLARVLRNRARSSGRSEARRAHRERVAARPEAGGGPDELLERAALQRELVEHVLALDEPYRGAILLRYFEELSPRAIAGRLGLPASTVRSRVARGLEQLRERLDSDRGRDDWLAGMVVLAGAPSSRSAPRWLAPLAATLAPAAGVALVLLAVRGEPEPRVEGAPVDDLEPVVRLVPPPPIRELVPPPQSPPTAPVVERSEAPTLPVQPAPPPVETQPVAAPPRHVPPHFPAPVEPTWVAVPADPRMAPPGLVRIPGGPTVIGSDADEVAGLVVRTRIRKLVGETPRHTARVDDFHLMRTEVTNEQYLAFVEATGAKPPQSWGVDALGAAIEAWNEDPRRALGDTFDAKAWWDAHWAESAYAVPGERDAYPAEHVDRAMAEAYARWAGLRLMSEREYQRAVRGDTARRYPWGDAFERGRAATLEEERLETWPVGSFPRGATEHGVHDLTGNVWEWTASRYLPYPDHEPLRVRFDSRRVELCEAHFDPRQYVVAGGSYANEELAARCSTRRATDPDEATEALGFRCAATPTPCYDAALHLAADATTEAFSGADPEELAPWVVGVDTWSHERGTATPEGYAVITGYHRVFLLPAPRVSGGSAAKLGASAERAGDEGIELGLLETSEPIVEPALEPGRYTLRLVHVEDGALELAFESWEDGGVVRAPAPELDFVRKSAFEPSATLRGPDVLVLHAVCAAHPLPRTLAFDLELRLAPGTLGGPWRATAP